MHWGDLTEKDDGKRVSVWFAGGRKYDDVVGQYKGVIHYTDGIGMPYLLDDAGVRHTFSWAYSVAFL